MLKKNPFRQWLSQATATLAITLSLTLSSPLWATAADNSQAPSAAKQSPVSDSQLTSSKAAAISEPLAALTQNNATYSYDELGRLSRISVNGKLVTEYQYDAAGNRTQKQHHQ
ncbi:RHS repeat domain-containing protein [Thalassomonas actiniarum]|uniref:RHS repeat protein n=1 Tax=Thalassomonas actiniarum TaxID=485447 RepID=A0AAF0C6J5_9GAMM|nr:RHS repeat domain-containing protein [Thalassomonas actiniarum]WDE02341.1 RHS repeat protein [Thalassomonas actiniarum]